MVKLGNDDTDDFDGLHLAFAQTLSNDVREEVMFARIPLYFLPFLGRDTGAILECTRHGSNGDAEVSCYILHRYAG